jgi:hypothetical protein
MIHHVIRASTKASATPDEIEAVLESWRTMGRTIPAVRSSVVGRDLGGQYQIGAAFSVDDLDGLFEYLTHPDTFRTDALGLHLAEKLDIFDISDDEDPDLYAKIQDLHRRRNELNPEVAQKLIDVPAYTGAGIED